MKKFELESFLPYLLNLAAEASSLEFQQVYKDRYGLLRNDWRVLFHLGLYGNLTASDIGARAKMHKTKISRAVQRLADRRFLTRVRDEEDRRVEHLQLTPVGIAAYNDLRKVAENYDAALVEHMSVTEVQTLKALLKRLAGR